MKLSDYLSDTNTSAESFAKEVGVSVSAVNYWRTGDRMPRIKQMQRIFEVTNGSVKPSDFFPFRCENDSEPPTQTASVPVASEVEEMNGAAQ